MMVKSSTYTSIVIIEPHGILREGLRALIELETDLRVVGEASTGADGVRVVQSTDPALVITDLAPPGTQGLRIIEQLRAASARVQVLVLTAYCTDEYIRAALGAGADGYVLKDAGRAELLQAIRSVIAGQKYFSERVSAPQRADPGNGSGSVPPDHRARARSADARRAGGIQQACGARAAAQREDGREASRESDAQARIAQHRERHAVRGA